MSPRFIEIDHRGFEHLLGDVPDCNGRWKLQEGLEVLVYMDGVNPATNSNLLAAEITGFREAIIFPLDNGGVGEASAVDVLGNERRIRAELKEPLLVKVQGSFRPNPSLIPGVV